MTFQERGTTPTCVSAAADVTPGPEPRPPVNGPIHPGRAAPGRTGREGGRSGAGLRAIVWLPRRWNPAGGEPLVRQLTEADAAGEERGDSEFPGVPNFPPSPGNDLGFLPRERRKQPISQGKVSQKEPRVLW